MTNSESRTTSTAHTPGPWTAEPEYEDLLPTYVHVDGRMIADCSSGYEGDIANARLIAAAPDLLAALREIQTTAENNKVLSPSAIADFCRTWIAKATGAAS